MPDSINDKLADLNVPHEVRMLRFTEGERLKVRRALRELEVKLIVLIQQVNPGGGESLRQQQSRQRILLKQTQELITATYRNISARNQTAMVDAMALETAVAATMVQSAVGVRLLTKGVSKERMRALASEQIVLGAPTKEWWSRQSQTLKTKFTDQIRQGVTLGESVDKVVRRIRGTRAANYTNGIMATSRHQAESLARTSMNSAANAGRLEMYQANDDVIKGVQTVVTFDLRTSDICIARAGTAWDLQGNPLPQSTRQETFPGPPPWHYGCRSTLQPILKTFKEILGKSGGRLDKQLVALPPATKASMNGQIADSIDFETWLKGRKVSEQKEVLGGTRQKLWSEGKLNLKDLIDQQGRPLTAEQVRKKAE